MELKTVLVIIILVQSMLMFTPRNKQKLIDMDYFGDDNEDVEDLFEEDEDYNENYDVSFEIRQLPRKRQVLKSCDFVDLNAVGKLCGLGNKIKVFKVKRFSRSKFKIFVVSVQEKTNPRPKHTIFFDGFSGHIILAVHSGNQWQCCDSSVR